MLRRQNREPIEKLIEQVRQMRNDVPAEAGAFQRQCDALLTAASALLSKRIFRDSEQLQNLQKKVDRLSSLASGLTQLVRGAQGVAESVSRLRESAKNDEQNALIAEKCDEWMRTIQGLGRDIDQERLLRLDEIRLRELQNSVRNYTRAMELLAEAAKLSRHADDLDRASLNNAALPAWREDFRNKGPSVQSLAELEKLLEPLQHRSTQPSPAPSKLPDQVVQLRRVFEELRAWARVVNQRVIPALEDPYRRLAQGNTPPAELQELKEKLGAEVARSRALATAERAARLQELRQDAGHYRRFCGENQELDERLDSLAKNPADTPANYEQWMIQFRNTDLFFLGVAQTKEDALAQGLRAVAAGLEQRRQAVLARSLTRELRNKTIALGSTLGQLNAATGQVEIREALRASDRLDGEILDLETRSEQDFAARQRRQAFCQQGIEALRAAAAACEKPGLVAAAEELAEHARTEESKDLDEIDQRLAQAEEELNRHTRTFLSECGLALDQIFNYCRDAHRAIAITVDALGAGAREPRFSGERPQPGTVSQIVGEFQLWKEQQKYYSARILELTPDLKQAIDAGKALLKQLAGKHGYFSPEQRHEAIELEQTMEAASSSPAASGDGLSRFAWLANLLDRYRSFTRLVEGEREELQKAHALLKERLSRFNAEEFKRFFPEEAERVSAFIFGVDPDHPRGSTRKQIDLASACLESLEAQAQRIAAEEMEEACAEAEILLRVPERSGDEQLRSALEEVREFSPLQLAPAPVRRRLLTRLVHKKGG